MMDHNPPTSTPVEKKKKKKHPKQASDPPLSSAGGAIAQTSNSFVEDGDGITRAIQTALDHTAAAGATASSSSAPINLSAPRDGPTVSGSRKRRAAGTANETAPDGPGQPKSKRMKGKGSSTSSSSSPSNTNQASATPDPNMSQLMPAYIPAHNGADHIPIDPALTANDQMLQHHSHPQSSPNAAFMSALTSAASADASVTNSYGFNQDVDLPMLSSNEDIIRALQGFDMSKFAGALKSYTDSLASGHPAPAQPHSQPSEAGSSRVLGTGLPNNAQPASAPSGSSGQKTRTRKIVAPQPGSQVVNPEHADILATHWLNPAKLAELVKEQGTLHSRSRLRPVINVKQVSSIKRESSRRLRST
jgi:hypothetical protein